jgi:hypothetical protein
METLKNVLEIQSNLARHPLFKDLTTVPNVRLFMESHVWAVWDFMSLLKRLQLDLTSVSLPWKPSPYSSQIVRLINEIVLGEESDLDLAGKPTSHFELYIKAMDEIGADTRPIRSFLKDGDFNHMPPHAQAFVKETLDVALHGDVIAVAASFFYGREKVIPGMFEGIVSVLKSQNIPCPTLIYYLDRHIHLDGEEHGPMSEKCLGELCDNDSEKLNQAITAAMKALKARDQFWSETHSYLLSDNSQRCDTLQSQAAALS